MTWNHLVRSCVEYMGGKAKLSDIADMLQKHPKAKANEHYRERIRATVYEDWRVRQAAMNACNGKDVPIDIIERGLKDEDCDVRQAAIDVIKNNNLDIEIPIKRTINPPEKVYKKCVGGVIVVATIPENAEVRGCYTGKCRANKAKIVDIIGDFCGEKVGISVWDRTTTYFIGDDIYIENFDLSNEECSTGFHFFCNKELAEKY